MLLLTLNNSLISLIIPTNTSQRASEFVSGLSLKQRISSYLNECSVDAILIHVRPRLNASISTLEMDVALAVGRDMNYLL